MIPPGAHAAPLGRPGSGGRPAAVGSPFFRVRSDAGNRIYAPPFHRTSPSLNELVAAGRAPGAATTKEQGNHARTPLAAAVGRQGAEATPAPTPAARTQPPQPGAPGRPD